VIEVTNDPNGSEGVVESCAVPPGLGPDSSAAPRTYVLG
jgi:hypothetical protein